MIRAPLSPWGIASIRDSGLDLHMVSTSPALHFHMSCIC